MLKTAVPSGKVQTPSILREHGIFSLHTAALSPGCPHLVSKDWGKGSSLTPRTQCSCCYLPISCFQATVQYSSLPSCLCRQCRWGSRHLPAPWISSFLEQRQWKRAGALLLSWPMATVCTAPAKHHMVGFVFPLEKGHTMNKWNN